MIVISLGWGVQSFTLAAMTALGELPPVDVALHADTKYEHQNTYIFAVKHTPWLEARGVKVIIVNANPSPDPVHYYNRVAIPAFVITTKGSGQFNRECTDNWKRRPIHRWLQANRDGQPVEQWIGISLDEAARMKPSNVKYITNRWPLIEKRMTRATCVRWLQSHDLEVPPKSACVFCPYHAQKEWQELKRRGGADWKKAVEVDNTIRKARPPFDLFIHPARIPLEEIDLRTTEEKGQMRLWDEECSGLCGV